VTIGLAFRPITPADEPFLLALYASTREEELAITGWSDREKDAFVRMQFAAQHRHYTTHYPSARFDVVLADGEPAGRLYVDRTPHDLHVIEISIAPAWRNRGIGARLLAELFAEADATGRVTSVYVEIHNPARRLYDRLGFEAVETGPIYLRLERRPGVPGEALVQPKLAS
jgi:ribosomal protein S18 acetylase RimI-like enzyme